MKKYVSNKYIKEEYMYHDKVIRAKRTHCLTYKATFYDCLDHSLPLPGFHTSIVRADGNTNSLNCSESRTRGQYLYSPA